MTGPISLYVHIPFCASRCPYCDFATAPARSALRSRYLDALGRRDPARRRAARSAARRDAVRRRRDAEPARARRDRQARRGVARVVPSRPGRGHGRGEPRDARPRPPGGVGFARHHAPVPGCAELLRARPARARPDAPGGGRRTGHRSRAVAGPRGEPRPHLRLAKPDHHAWRGGPARAAVSLQVPTTFPLSPRARARARGGRRQLARRRLAVRPSAGDDVAPRRSPRTTPPSRRCTSSPKRSLRSAGFEHYEIANWARPGRRCQHNLAYWRNDQWLGLGTGAHTHLGGGRSRRPASLVTYLDAIERGASPIPLRTRRRTRRCWRFGWMKGWTSLHTRPDLVPTPRGECAPRSRAPTALAWCAGPTMSRGSRHADGCSRARSLSDCSTSLTYQYRRRGRARLRRHSGRATTHSTFRLFGEA